MTCDIVIRSYWKDFSWLAMCAAAIETYCRGFRSVVVIVPRASEPWLRRHPPLPQSFRLELCADYRDDYLGQQATKLLADQYTDAEFICHVDSDCIFARPTTPDDLIDDGKAVISKRPHALLGRHWPWRRPTEAFLGCGIEDDFMQRPPFTYPRWIYPELRDFARRSHGIELEHYVITRPPRGFSEFNALGAFAWIYHRDRFVWIDHDDSLDSVCRWYWSWGGLDDVTRREIELLIGMRERDDVG